MKSLKIAAMLLPWMLFSPIIRAVEPFVVEDIRIEGLQRISAGTVFNYLPVKAGDTFDGKQSAEAIKALFKTGFFKDVRLEQSGTTLVVVVDERPSIASIKLEGNKDISSDDLGKALKGTGLAEGKVFDRQVLDKVEQELRRQYFSRGKYGIRVESEVTDISRNRVDIRIRIAEGKVARIRQINIVGNNAFPDKRLLKEFELSTPNLLSFYTKDDQYSRQKLSADLERLRSFYLDRGYINFEVESTQVSITPDKREIYINVNVREGEVHQVSEVKLTGKLIVAPDTLTPLVKIGPADTFSRKLATETAKAISDRLGDEGYIFANVNMVPDVDAARKTVAITFFVDPGKQVYVHRINFHGNSKTRDEVLRREMRQMEAAWASSSKIERSKTRLERLGYFQEVNVETPATVGTGDQIDVNYTVVEKPSGNLMAGVGYSQAQGVIFNASISQDNVFGSGKRVNLTFNNSFVNTIYKIGYLNPYTTLDGISSGFDIGYRKTNAAQMNIARYNTDVLDTGVNLGIPLNEFDSLRFNLDYENTRLSASDRSSQEIYDFMARYGKKFNTVTVATGYIHDTLNRALMPTRGGAQKISLLGTVPAGNIDYYKASLKLQQYFPLARDLTVLIEGEVAYGDGYGDTHELPFFENYFAGGPQSVRGFQPNTLGPRDSKNLPFGGASKLAGTAELFFPVPFMEESKTVRLGAFMDVGNVFKRDLDIGDLRYSTGLSARWLSPFGALVFSVAQPVNATRNDKVQYFQFSFGSGF
jgi:outer membrane protein insertion porin family